MKKIIFINRFFWPDHSATAQILTDLTRNLCLEDFKIHIITSRQTYDNSDVRLKKNEEYEGVTIHRVWTSRFGRSNLVGRSVDYASFYVTSFILMIRMLKKKDILVAKTDPPLISVFSAMACKLKRARMINWLQDLFPEVGKELDISILRNRWIYILVEWLRNKSLLMAEANVVLGQLMKDRLSLLLGDKTRVEIIPNWVASKGIKEIDKNNNKLIQDWGISGKFVIGYSGNLGRAHYYMTIYKAAKKLVNVEKIVFLMIGGGAGYEKLMELCSREKVKNIIFKPYQPLDMLSLSLSVADVHVITLESNLEGLIVPSKYYGVLAVSRPIVFIGDRCGELGSEITKYDLGYTVPVGSENEFVSAIQCLYKDKDLKMKKSANIKKIYKNKYKAENSYEKWRKIFYEM